jgi:ABC-type sugar transport system substrate-binding protein
MHFSRQPRRRAAQGLVAITVVAIVGACSSGPGTTATPSVSTPPAESPGTSVAPSPSAAGLFGEPVVTLEPASISDEWVVWSTDTCTYEPVADHPDTWVANLRAANGLLLGHMEQSEDNELNLLKNASVKDAAALAGFELLQVNGRYPDKAAMVTAAQNIATRDPVAVVQDNPLADLADQLNSIYEEACIPFVQLSLASEGAITFGASNEDIGLKQGEFLVEYAKAQGWEGSEIVAVGTPVAGLGPINARPDICGAHIVENLPGATYDPLPLAEGLTEEVTTVATNWLTAHPDVKVVLGCVISGLQAAGIDNALLAAERGETAAIMSVGATETTLAELPDTSRIVGSVDQGFGAPDGRYATFAISMVQDAAAGNPVPVFVYTPLQVIPTP